MVASVAQSLHLPLEPQVLLLEEGVFLLEVLKVLFLELSGFLGSLSVSHPLEFGLLPFGQLLAGLAEQQQLLGRGVARQLARDAAATGAFHRVAHSFSN